MEGMDPCPTCVLSPAVGLLCSADLKEAWHVSVSGASWGGGL